MCSVSRKLQSWTLGITCSRLDNYSTLGILESFGMSYGGLSKLGLPCTGWLPIPSRVDLYIAGDPCQNLWKPTQCPRVGILLVPTRTYDGWRTVEAFHWWSWCIIVQSCWTIHNVNINNYIKQHKTVIVKSYTKRNLKRNTHNKNILISHVEAISLEAWLKDYLFDKFNTSQEIHSEIDKGPFDSFSGIFFLFQYEHVVVKELLKFFIRKVDTQLFKSVELDRTRHKQNQHILHSTSFRGCPMWMESHPLRCWQER